MNSEGGIDKNGDSLPSTARQVADIVAPASERVIACLNAGKLQEALLCMGEYDPREIEKVIRASLPSEMKLAFVASISQSITPRFFKYLESALVGVTEFDDKVLMASFEINGSPYKIIRFTDGTIITRLSVIQGYKDIGRFPEGPYKGYYYAKLWNRNYDIYRATGVRYQSGVAIDKR